MDDLQNELQRGMCANATNACFHLTMVLDDTWIWDPRKEMEMDVLQHKAWTCLQHYTNLLFFSTSRIAYCIKKVIMLLGLKTEKQECLEDQQIIGIFHPEMKILS